MIKYKIYIIENYSNKYFTEFLNGYAVPFECSKPNISCQEVEVEMPSDTTEIFIFGKTAVIRLKEQIFKGVSYLYWGKSIDLDHWEICKKNNSISLPKWLKGD